MKVENFKSFLRHKPFKPFVIHTASGENYKVASPESIWVSRNGEEVIAQPPNGDIVMMGVEHITEAVYKAAPTKKGAKHVEE